MLRNRSMPSSTVIPQLPYPDVEQAAAWLARAFGFTLRIAMGSHRAQLNAGDGAVVLMQNPAGAPIAPSAVMVRVSDARAHHDHAVQNGVRILRPPADYPYGERQYTAQDPAGHTWTFSQSIADIDPSDWGGTPGQL